MSKSKLLVAILAIVGLFSCAVAAPKKAKISDDDRDFAYDVARYTRLVQEKSLNPYESADGFRDKIWKLSEKGQSDASIVSTVESSVEKVVRVCSKIKDIDPNDSCFVYSDSGIELIVQKKGVEGAIKDLKKQVEPFVNWALR